MLRSAFAALRAAHFSLYLSVLFWAGLSVVIYLLSDIKPLLSAGYAGEIVGGYWMVQGGFALMEKAKKAIARSRDRSID